MAKKNKTGNASSFFMLYDAFQLVSLRANDTAELPRVIREADCKLTLYKNCRNTHSIANAAASGILGDGRHPEMAAGALPGTTPQVVFIEPKTKSEDYALAVGKRIGKLREEFSADDIVVLSCSPYGEGFSRLEKKRFKVADFGRFSTLARRLLRLIMGVGIVRIVRRPRRLGIMSFITPTTTAAMPDGLPLARRLFGMLAKMARSDGKVDAWEFANKYASPEDCLVVYELLWDTSRARMGERKGFRFPVLSGKSVRVRLWFLAKMCKCWL